MNPIKTLIKGSVRALGFELYPIFKPGKRLRNGRYALAPVRLSMEESLAHLKRLGYVPSLIVDVGAAEGTPPLLRTWPKIPTIWIEPLQEFGARLNNLAQKHPGRVVLAAAGEKSGRLAIHVHGDLFGSSLLQESDGEAADGRSREVPIIRLDDEVDLAKAGDAVLLKLDVQGAELQALDGAPRLLKQCEVVIMEVNFFNLQKGSPVLLDVLTYMKDRGFVAYDIFDGHNRPLDDALAQRDVLFVKENGRFRRSHQWAAKGQREQVLGS